MRVICAPAEQARATPSDISNRLLSPASSAKSPMPTEDASRSSCHVAGRVQRWRAGFGVLHARSHDHPARLPLPGLPSRKPLETPSGSARLISSRDRTPCTVTPVLKRGGATANRGPRKPSNSLVACEGRQAQNTVSSPNARRARTRGTGDPS